jgi:hypothetical protein
MHEALWSLPCELRWSLTLASIERTGGAEKFGPPPEKYFFDSIDPHRSCGDPLLDHLVGGGQQRFWYCKTERLGGFQVDHRLVFRRRLHRQVGRLLALEDAIDVAGGKPVLVEPVGP